MLLAPQTRWPLLTALSWSVHASHTCRMPRMLCLLRLPPARAYLQGERRNGTDASREGGRIPQKNAIETHGEGVSTVEGTEGTKDLVRTYKPCLLVLFHKVADDGVADCPSHKTCPHARASVKRARSVQTQLPHCPTAALPLVSCRCSILSRASPLRATHRRHRTHGTRFLTLATPDTGHAQPHSHVFSLESRPLSSSPHTRTHDWVHACTMCKLMAEDVPMQQKKRA